MGKSVLLVMVLSVFVTFRTGDNNVKTTSKTFGSILMNHVSLKEGGTPFKKVS